MTTPGVLYLGMGNIVTEIIIGMIIFLALEYPIKRFIEVTIISKISHSELLK